MKLALLREDLLSPLQQIIGAVEKRQTMPALSNILLCSTAQGLTLTATDLEIELQATLSNQAEQPGEITLPARKLLDICKALPVEAEIALSIKDEKALLQSGKSRFSLATLPAKDFPVLDSIKPFCSFELPQSTLKTMVEKTAFAMAQQDVRYYLNGLLLDVAPNKIRAVATDGHRLAYCEKEANIEINEVKQVIVPRKGVIELMRLLAHSDKTVKVSLASNHLQIEFDNVRFTSKLIDGRFPDYNRVIPDATNCLLTADREALRLALVKASILSNEKYRGIRLSVNSNILKLQAQNPDHEEADVELEVNYKGENLEIGFNVNYMLDVLNASGSSMVQAALRDTNSSCLLSFPDQKDVKYVIMPMRL